MELFDSPRLSFIYIPALARRSHFDRSFIRAEELPAQADANEAKLSVFPRRKIRLGTPRVYTGQIIAKDGSVDGLVTVPPINRTPMAPEVWESPPPLAGKRSTASRAKGATQRSDSPDPRDVWRYAATFRRSILLAAVIGQTALATHFMTQVLPYHGAQPLEVCILVLFAALFGWVSAGFWTALMGFFVLVSGGDRYSISRTAVGNAPINPRAKTAIVMPICNESIPRVFAGLRATYESLARTGELEHFDFYVLSDTSDISVRESEAAAWRELCESVGGFGRIYYRHRRHRIKRKSGNVADFCRRWGSNYRYMVVLDADSVMSGDCLAKLVRLMEANPNAGIIQTAPHAAGRETLYARIQQFATSVYGPLFVAGLHFWQLGESHYWGHNAIIRVAPFIRHCALPRLPGRGSLSGEILSHDFVEAALMRRAGWAVWIAHDLPGSYEETPSNLIDELKRDRRWCHGNLMNFRLLFAPGFHPAHRTVFLTGAVAYVSAPLWLLFLMLSTWLLTSQTLTDPQYFIEPNQLFPRWPHWDPELAIALSSATATLLFFPKVLAVVLAHIRGASRFGGTVRLILSMLGEVVFSALLAPVRMLFHSEFVIAALLGRSTQWRSPSREDAQMSWRDAFAHHGMHTLFGALWAGFVYLVNPAFLWWLLPIVVALMLSMPISVCSSRIFLGRAARNAGLFLISEESNMPTELRATRKYSNVAAERLTTSEDHGVLILQTTT